jgi:hypothetical protein
MTGKGFFGLLGRMISDLFTEANNTVLDIKRVSIPPVVGTYLFAQVHATVVQHQVFNPLEAGGGAAAVLAAIGALLHVGRKAESDSEPGA